MGGNALSEVNTHRLDRAEYLTICDEVLAQLRHNILRHNISRRIVDIPAYRNKESFGDLDILLETFSGDNIDYRSLIIVLFAPKQIVQNNNCYSFDYKDFQIDLILTPTTEFNTTLSYFSWNDLGNLAGRIFKKLGFKYGHRGLSYLFREDDLSHTVYAETIVSQDIQQIMAFGGLDYDKFIQGFDTIDDMFVWISSSKYFHKDIYLFHNRNHISRTRDKKRKNYHLFLEWCANTPNLNAYPWTEMREQDGYAGKPEFLELARKQFDGFAAEYDCIVGKHNEHKIFREKFNGNIVCELTGLTGKDLGMFMQHMTKIHGGKESMFEEMWFLEQVDIIAMILDAYGSYYVSSEL